MFISKRGYVLCNKFAWELWPLNSTKVLVSIKPPFENMFQSFCHHFYLETFSFFPSSNYVLKEIFEASSEGSVLVTEAYQPYVERCNILKITALSIHHFGIMVHNSFPQVRIRRITVKNDNNHKKGTKTGRSILLIRK